MFKRIAIVVMMLLITFSTQFTSISHAEEGKTATFPDTLSLENVTLQIMPEYFTPPEFPAGKPTLLHGYFLEVKNNDAEPYTGTLEFQLPYKENDFMLTYVGEVVDGETANANFDFDEETGILSITPSLPIESGQSQTFGIEFCTSEIKGDQSKSFEVKFSAPAPIKTADVLFIAPLTATNIVVPPEATANEKMEGVESFKMTIPGVQKGQELSFKMSYDKESDQTTEDMFMEQENIDSAGGTGTSDDSEVSPYLVISIIVFVFAIIVVLAVLQRNRKLRGKANTQMNGTSQPISSELKQLRKQLIAGEIDQANYDEKRSKL